MWFLTIHKVDGFPGPYNDRESATEVGVPIADSLDADVALLHFNYDTEAGIPTPMAIIKPCGCVKNDPKFNRLGDYERKCEKHND